MGKINDKLWRFSAIPGIEESSFNKVLEKFYDFGIAGLVRENVQNSLDGKLPGINEPVKITIRTGKVKDEEIPGLGEIKERILCLEGRNSYTRETIDYMKNKMNVQLVPYISFEDENTKGLAGAKNGQSNSDKDTWSVYAYNKGVHSEDSDDDHEKSRGGSHGIGKIASNAASDLYMMYFANCDEDGNRHLGGTVQLIEHKYEDKYYRSTGYFTNIKQLDDTTTKFYPFENNFGGIFSKDTRGLKIIIPFLRSQFNDEKEIIKSICDNFFIAVLQNKLIVNVNDKIIDKTTIEDYILNNEYYVQETSEIKEEFTPLYFTTYKNIVPRELSIKDRENEYEFMLYFNYDEEITKGRVGIIRTIGMKIEDKKIIGNANKPFNAVLIPKSIIEDSFLKSLENESHTELTFEHIKDQKLQKNAKRFLNNLAKEIAKVIEEEMNKNNPTDGKMNTSDILYVIDNQFKQQLSKSINRVKLKSGIKEKEIIEITTRAKKEKTDSKNSKETEHKKKEKKQKAVKKITKEDPTTNTEDIEKNSVFKTKPDVVERLIINNQEYLKFDFTEAKEVKKATYCDISLSEVDGSGDQSKDTFDLNGNYQSVIDRASGRELKVIKNKIKDASINKGIVQLQISTKENYNKALKFIYYVEV
ncbi:hypothetical protein [Inconstantimicrobium porci]|uniref:Uncharacterized protein n=1 Tax=Inconstantimicrobium porci TaxID=2652291 RepID=A0A7X2MZT1_9CLOT|nr:hypothetical protein [Inconstantimicrobium porci]MSR92097.1 hypothetical protein [Inconstantimicrobium porci]